VRHCITALSYITIIYIVLSVRQLTTKITSCTDLVSSVQQYQNFAAKCVANNMNYLRHGCRHKHRLEQVDLFVKYKQIRLWLTINENQGRFQDAHF